MIIPVLLVRKANNTEPLTFITGLKNQLSLKVKVIRSDNGTEFKNSDLNQFYGLKGIMREFNSLLPIPFWAEEVNTACYVQNRVLVTKPHNKTPYELLHGRTPSIGFMRPFGCPVTILNTLDYLGKFQGKVNEGFLVGYFMCSKAFSVFNSRTRIVQKTLHVNFLENKPNVAGAGPTWLFDIDSLSGTMNYHPVSVANQTNSGADNDKDALVDGKEHGVDIQKSVSADIYFSSSSAQTRKQADKIEREDKGKSPVESFTGYKDLNAEFKECSNTSSNGVNAASSLVPTAGHNFINRTNNFSAAGPSNTSVSLTYENSSFQDASTSSHDPDMPALEDFTYSDDEAAVGADADINNLEFSIPTRSIVRAVKDQGGLSQMSDKDFHTCMFACFLSQEEPKRIHQALKDPSWIEAMQEKLLQFKMQKVWILVDLPYEKRAIGTKWVYKNKKDERGIVIRNKARLVAQGHTQEKGIDYEEVFAPVARIEAIRLCLAYASFMGFLVYQIDVKSAFLYGTIEEEVYVCQPPGFEDPDHPDKVYKVVKAIYGLHQAPRAWYETLATYLLENGFQRGTIDQTLFIKKQQGDILLVQIYVDDIIFGATNKALCKSFEKLMKDRFQMSSMGELTFFLGLQVKQKKDAIFISQDKYVAEILRKFGLTEGKSASTPIDAEKPLLKDPNGEDVDVHTYSARSKQLLLLHPQRLNMLLLPVAVLKCCGFKINYWIMGCSLWHMVIEMVVTYIISDAHLITTNGVQLTMVFNSPMLYLLRVEMVLNSPCPYWVYKSWLVQKKMALSKDTSNPLMADNLPKIIWYSTHHITFMKSWLVQKQTALGKDSSNPLTVDSLLKTIWFSIHHHLINEVLAIPGQTITGVNTPRSDEDRLEILELTVLMLQMVFWNTATIKQSTDVTRLQALVDKKKVVISKAVIRKVLRLDDAEGVDCLPNKEIFTGLAQMGYEKPSTKLTFYKAFFSKVVKAASALVSAASIIIPAAEPNIPAVTINAAPVKVVATSTRRRRGVVIKDLEEESSAKTSDETKSKDKGKGYSWDVAIEHVKQKAKEDPFIQRYQVMKKRPQTEAQARRNMIMYLKNTVGFKLDYFKWKSYDDIRLIFEAKFNTNMEFLLKSKEQIEEEESRALESINETPAQKAAKRRRLNHEDKDVEEIKQHLEIVPDEEDDVYTEATPLDRKCYKDTAKLKLKLLMINDAAAASSEEITK
nr:hypothetical protein [Tanacetum cinerariifolium]